MSDIKSFLHQFCQKTKKEQPQFEVRPTGPKHRQRFLCEVRIDGFSYVGAGNSTTKKDAQTNAARDFVNYLVREGVIKSSDVPELQDVDPPSTSEPGNSVASRNAQRYGPWPNIYRVNLKNIKPLYFH